MKKILLIPTLAAMSAAPLTVLCGCTVHLNPPTPPEPPEPEEDPLYFENVAEGETASIGYTVTGELFNIHIQTSSDGTDWDDWDGTSIDLAPGGILYVRNTENSLSTYDEYSGMTNYLQFNITGNNVKAGGNVNSMINYSDLSAYCFYGLFDYCQSLIQASDLLLPADTLADSCYAFMFRGCSSLKQAPALPADTLANYCYDHMFSDCGSLEEVPALPATTLSPSCYSNMFFNCDGLITLPSNLLPSTTLANNCYLYMFNSCDNLTTAPALPTEEFNEGWTGCYEEMFANCSSLKVRTDGPETKIFTCPATGINPEFYFWEMFELCAGTLPDGTPIAGNTYYWYTE